LHQYRCYYIHRQNVNVSVRCHRTHNAAAAAAALLSSEKTQNGDENSKKH